MPELSRFYGIIIKLVVAWLVLHEDEIYAAWNNAVASKPFDRVAPLS